MEQRRGEDEALVARISRLFCRSLFLFSMSFNECPEHSTQLMGFVGPSVGCASVEVSGFDADQDLCS